MILDQMIDIILANTGNDSSNKSEYSSRFIAAINYAKGKIARERYAPDYTETVPLIDGVFDTSTLSKQLLEINKITDANDQGLSWQRISSTQIKVPGQTSVVVNYNYLPADLVSGTDVLDLPPSVIDPQVLCFYAIYQYYLIEGGNPDLNLSSYWLNLWNDGFNSIKVGIGETFGVKSVYSVGA